VKKWFHKVWEIFTSWRTFSF